MIADALARLIERGGTLSLGPGYLVVRGDGDCLELLASGLASLVHLDILRTTKTCNLEAALGVEEQIIGAPAAGRSPRPPKG